MLLYLYIVNFAIIQKLELDFKNGLTVISGETGAGKSIIIDALSFALGARADTSLIRHQEEKCEISACFDLTNIPKAKNWIIEHDYQMDNGECIIRRILYRDGRSKLMVNGSTCSSTQIKEFASLVISLHSQNQQQSLLRKSFQRELLDHFGSFHPLCHEVANHYFEMQEAIKTFDELKLLTQKSATEMELLKYQISEFEKLSLIESEYEQLDQEHKHLSQAENILQLGQHTIELLSDNDSFNALHSLYQCINWVQSLSLNHLNSVSECLHNATIEVEEAVTHLKQFLQKIEINPERLQTVEKRIAGIHELSRKHQVPPSELLNLYHKLKKQLLEMTNSDERLNQLQNQIEVLRKDYFCAAEKLSCERKKAGKKLSKNISAKIKELGMPSGFLDVQFHLKTDPSPTGIDDVEFMVTTNPGLPLQALTKVASGGEISRIALAIYVVTAQHNTTPVLVFDEVDVGIGGQIAASVGQLLKALGNDNQVMCITHLPQVAAYGHHHVKVQKKIIENRTITELIYLNAEEKITEIARMLGGMSITHKTLEHAREMLGSVS